MVLDEDFERLGLEAFPDTLHHEGNEFTVYYHAQPGERDDGVTLGVHVDQLPKLPACPTQKWKRRSASFSDVETCRPR